MPGKGLRKPHNLTCPVCGKSLHIKPSHLVRRKYCSTTCFGIGTRRGTQKRVEEQYQKPIYNIPYDLYYKENHSVRQIATILDISLRSLWDWFDDLEIPRRDSAEGVRLGWMNNDERRALTKSVFEAWRKANPEKVRAQSLRANLAQQHKKYPTSIEKLLMDALDAKGVQYIFQYEVGNKFLCDFGFPESMLIVECDGDYWHSRPIQKKRDASKDAYLHACGYTVLRFSGTRLTTDIKGCMDSILSQIGLNKK